MDVEKFVRHLCRLVLRHQMPVWNYFVNSFYSGWKNPPLSTYHSEVEKSAAPITVRWKSPPLSTYHSELEKPATPSISQ